jgi:exodeoxyribonuclease V beta subunit
MTLAMREFDHLKTDLDGRKLIESSAGTGKTYAIASLYVRLLLERNLQVHQILVVTFTEAATAELQSRIRGKIREALQAFEGAKPSDDFIAQLVAQTGNAACARWVLAEALYAFDQAAIFTIHGFCRKALQENAFESSSNFNTELLTDQSAVCRQIVEDFWRENFYRTSSLLVKRALDEDLQAELLRLIGTSIAFPTLKVIPEGLKPDFAGLNRLESRGEEAKGALAKIWAQDSGKITRILLTDPGLSRTSYRVSTVEKWLEQLEPYFASAQLLPQPDWLPKVCPDALAKGTKKGCSPPQHAFFDAVEALLQCLSDLEAAITQCMLALKSEFIGYARQQLPKRKRERNVRSFDDLLLDMREALKRPAGGMLAAKLRARFKAALIDEFQDTDPVQYEIFRAIFDSQSSLFLIGDPKQSIYGFRGADIFAYLKAKEDVRDQFTLNRNWRSTEDLVNAVNTIFKQSQAPFVFQTIEYSQSKAADKPDQSKFVLEGEGHTAPLKLWFMAREDPSLTKPTSKEAAERKIAGVTASEIVRLLNAGRQGRARIEGRKDSLPISPWDIAVLVRTNAQARQVQQALRERKVPSVIYGTGNVFETEEAAETGRLLLAIADPGNEGRVKAALATSILGLSGDELARLSENDSAWDARLRTFAEYRDMWLGQGFVTMARTLLAREGVRRRLLAFPDGERRLTDLLHCIELLQNAAAQGKLGIDGLLKWFAAQQQGAAEDQETQQIRLETDEKALKVVTVHKSKGLEFPIVFCPYVWHTVSPNQKHATFHDPQDKTVLIKDLGSEDLAGHQALELQESLAEQCRLFYVALTRAKYRCYTCWGAISGAGLSAPAHLFHEVEVAGEPDLAGAVRAHFTGLSDTQILKDLNDLARSSEGTIEVLPLPADSQELYRPPDQEAPVFSARRFSGEIARDWGTASFSSWTAGGPHAVEMPDHDAVLPAPAGAEAPELPAQAAKTIIDFPRGTRAGSCLHAVFEALDFAASGSPLAEELVGEQLDTFGFDRTWRAPVCDMVRDVLATPLNGAGGTIVLGQLAGDRRLAEMEFNFPLGRVTPHELKKVFAAHPAAPVSARFADQLGRLGFAPLRGMMKGFIDLVFEWGGRYYLLDWKSNYLGPGVEDYAQPALQKVMESSYYVLQYHLYAVALHRYLDARLPGYSYDQHFGGVFYIFLRGVNPARGPQFGVYHDKPPLGRIAALSALLSEDSAGTRK